TGKGPSQHSYSFVWQPCDILSRRRSVSCHGKRTSNAWEAKELCQVLNVPPGPLALDFQRPFGRVATQQGYGQPVQERDVLGSRPLIQPPGVLPKDDIQHPMQAVLNTPVAPN